jgi:hypothetical protein
MVQHLSEASTNTTCVLDPWMFTPENAAYVALPAHPREKGIGNNQFPSSHSTTLHMAPGSMFAIVDTLLVKPGTRYPAAGLWG